MNKTISLGIAAMLAASGVMSALGTDGNNQVPDEQIDQELEDFMPEPILVYTLNLDDAIEYGLNSDFSLMNLQYQLDNLESIQAGTEYDHRKIQRDIKDLEKARRDLRNLQNAIGESTFQQRYAIQEQLKEIEKIVESLEDAIEELKSGQVVLRYNKEAAEEAMKLSIISSFTNLKKMEEQINFTKQTLDTQKQRVDNLKRQYELGAIPRTEYETAKREVTTLESQMVQLEDQLKSNTAVFALNIGIEYHPELKLEKLNINQLELVEQEIETEELIENSFDMKVAKENLEYARSQRDKVYDDKDSSKHDKEQAEIAVEQKLLEITQLRVDGKNTIESLYSNVKLQHQALKDAENEVAYAKEDFENMKKRFEIGVISKADYELSEMSLTQATFNYEMEKYNYYLLLKQVELLEAGVIPTN